jgi:hypothetical protein
MKEDTENIAAGKTEVSSEAETETVASPNEIPSPQPPRPETPIVQSPKPSAPDQKVFSAPPAPSSQPRIPSSTPGVSPVRIPTQQSNNLPFETKPEKGALPNPLGTETFFQTRSPFDDKNIGTATEPPKTEPKPSGKSAVIISAVLILALAGGGAYYWWFFMRSSEKTSPPTPQVQTPPTTEPASQQTALKQWDLDIEAGAETTKLAINQNAKNIAASDSTGKAIEIKIISKDNQLVSPAKFSEIFDFRFPASMTEKLSSDYSVFLFAENGEPKLGAAFKLSQADGLAESLKSEEKDFISGFKSFYLDKALSETEAAFNSGKYKNADIRYFNIPGPENASFDYTLLSGKTGSYFIFSTSKNSIRAILDYMSEK